LPAADAVRRNVLVNVPAAAWFLHCAADAGRGMFGERAFELLEPRP